MRGGEVDRRDDARWRRDAFTAFGDVDGRRAEDDLVRGRVVRQRGDDEPERFGVGAEVEVDLRSDQIIVQVGKSNCEPVHNLKCKIKN